MIGRSAVTTLPFASLAVLASLLSGTAANAAPTLYDDETDFLAALNDAFTDEYDDPGYPDGDNVSDAAMSAVLGETDYSSTGWPSSNLVLGGNYCVGCNGSFETGFTTTSIGTADGVQAVGVEIQQNSGSYSAYITFEDGTTSVAALPTPMGSYWGVTSQLRIERIHFSPNGVLAGEFCDDGGESAACDVDCTPAECGDDVVNESAGEECDDDERGCSAQCELIEGGTTGGDATGSSSGTTGGRGDESGRGEGGETGAAETEDPSNAQGSSTSGGGGVDPTGGGSTGPAGGTGSSDSGSMSSSEETNTGCGCSTEDPSAPLSWTCFAAVALLGVRRRSSGAKTGRAQRTP